MPRLPVIDSGKDYRYIFDRLVYFTGLARLGVT